MFEFENYELIFCKNDLLKMTSDDPYWVIYRDNMLKPVDDNADGECCSKACSVCYTYNKINLS